MIKEFEELMVIKNCVETFFKDYKENQNIILFGAGFSLTHLLHQLLDANINIVAICDNSTQKQGLIIDNLEVISFENSRKHYPDALYIISSHKYFWDIYNDLLERLPFEQVCNIDFECSHYFYGHIFKKYFMDNISEFEKVYKLFSDDDSRHLFIQTLKAHFSGERKAFDKIYCGLEDWYLFQTLLKPNPDSIYVDCGAYDGDTVLLFHKNAKDGYKKIIALEPDPSIQNSLKELIKTNNIKNIEVLNEGAFNEKGIVSFVQSGVYSNISNLENKITETISISVDTIDNIVQNQPVDIIKMDIEGSEYFALQGAKNTITKYKPRLAICLYHTYEDFLRIPLLINELQKGYKFYLKHQSYGCTDTILFAVCDESNY